MTYSTCSMCSFLAAVAVCLLSFHCINISAFNVDLDNYILHRGQNGTMFGFSVAQYIDKGVSWLIVGAPEADTDQPGVRQAGAVYRCSTESPDTCQQIPFDRTGNNRHGGDQIDEKSNQWFGATVHSSGINGVIVACAPRYVWFSSNKKRREPVGTCYISTNSFTDYAEYPPCRTSQWGYHRQGSCQAGLGAAVTPDSSRLFIGAVGSWYWQGQVYAVNATTSSGTGGRTGSEIRDFVSGGQLFSQDLLSRPDLQSSPEGPATDDDSYLGYSVAVGEFSGDGLYDVAVGMPRGNNLTGKVVLYTSNLTHIYNITGSQIGAYFGYAICVSDVDGDGFDDVIIGAPMYTDFKNNTGNFETGKVYIIYQRCYGERCNTLRRKGQLKFRLWDDLDGTDHRGRFGLALTTLGDINKDRYGDFAVGAPYGGRHGKGAVYIYHGSSEGVRKEWSQVIFAEDISTHINTFGFSLSGGLDLDENDYPDILVGAYNTNAAVYLKTRPVVNLLAKITFSPESKQINLEERGCKLADGTNVSCVVINIFLEFEGIGVEKKMEFDVQYVLDSKQAKSPRMFFLTDEGRNIMNQTIKLEKNAVFQKSLYVYVKPNVRDKLSPIEAELRYSMKMTHIRVRRGITPILNKNSPAVQRDTITIQKNCGQDNTCYPDLDLIIIPNTKSYLIGQGKLEIEVVVVNNGEDSFETMYYMVIPNTLDYVSVKTEEKNVSVLCSAPQKGINSKKILRCDIGNPLSARKEVRFKIILEQERTKSRVLQSSYDFYIEVNSTNAENETDRANNYMELSIPIRVQTDYDVRGRSEPENVPYNSSMFTDKEKISEFDIGPEINHTYEIVCRGPSHIEEVEFVIIWPSYTKAGDPLLYLLQQPATSVPGVCEHVTDVNVFRLKVVEKDLFHSVTHGIIGESSHSVGSIGNGRIGSSNEGETVSITHSSSSDHIARGGGRGYIDEEDDDYSYSRGGSRTTITEHGRVVTSSSGVHQTSQHGSGTGARVSGGSTSGSRSGGHYISSGEEERELVVGENRGSTHVTSESESTAHSHSEVHRTSDGGSTGYSQGGSASRGTGNFQGGIHGSSASGSGSTGHYQGGTRRTGTSVSESGSTGHYQGGTHRTGTSESESTGHYQGGTHRTGTSESGSTGYYQGGTHRTGTSVSESGSTGHYQGGTRRAGTIDLGSTGSTQVRTHRTRINEDGATGNFQGGTRRTSISESGSTGHSQGGTYRTGTSDSGFTGNSQGETHRTRTETGSVGNSEDGSATHLAAGRSGEFRTHFLDIGVGGGEDNQGRGATDISGSHGTSEGNVEVSGSSHGSHGRGGHRTRTRLGDELDLTHRTEDDLDSRNNRNSVTTGSSNIHFTSTSSGTSSGPRRHHIDNDGIGFEMSHNVDEEDTESNHNRGRSESHGLGGHSFSGNDLDHSGQRTSQNRTIHRTKVTQTSEHGRNADFDENYYSGASHGGGGLTHYDHSYTGNINSDNTGSTGDRDLEGGRDHSYSHSGTYDEGGRQIHYSSSGGVTRNSSTREYGIGSGGIVRETVRERNEERKESRTSHDIRHKRSVKSDFEKALDCGPTNCTFIYCKISPLDADKEVFIKLRARLWMDTLKKAGVEDVYLSSKLVARVTMLPHNVDPEYLGHRSHEVITEIIPEPDLSKSKPVPWWVVVLAALGGVLILLAIALILYKLGFFKRKRPQDIPEREPLHRNGHFQPGDEPL